MADQNLMQYTLIGILMICGYIYLLQLLFKRSQNRAVLPLAAVVLLLIYVMIAVPLLIILSRLGNPEMVFMAVLMLAACLVLFAAVAGFFRDFYDINKGMLALFIAYLLAVAYVTIFSRSEVRVGTGEGGIYMFRFDMIQEAVRTRSLQPVNHLLLNVAMFVPIGFLLPFLYPEKLGKWSYALMAGMLCTTVIEAVQMLFRLGQADLTDIVTNILGALVGRALYGVFRRLFPRDDADDEG